MRIKNEDTYVRLRIVLTFTEVKKWGEKCKKSVGFSSCFHMINIAHFP